MIFYHFPLWNSHFTQWRPILSLQKPVIWFATQIWIDWFLHDSSVYFKLAKLFVESYGIWINFNIFQANVSLLYLLKTENFDVFRDM